MGWSAAITDRAGAVRAFVLPSGLKLTRRLNGYAEVAFDLSEEADATKALEAAAASRAVALWRDGAIMFRGQIGSVVDALSPDTARVTVNAFDPFYWLQSRFVRTETAFTAEDAGAIAWSLIDAQNAFETTGLAEGSITASVDRDRTYEAGKQVAEAITQLAEVDNGFFFRLDPLSPASSDLAELVVMYPSSGATADDARFAYGQGTEGTITDLPSIEQLPPVNRVTAYGEGIVSTAEDASSISTYGLCERVVSFPDVVIQATLDDHAAGELRPDPVRTFTFAGAPSPSSSSPVLGSGFNVGDTVPVFVEAWRVSFEASCRVLAATVAVSDDGESESLTSVVVEEL